MSKVKTLNEVLVAARRARKQGKKIVSTNGCFDILHVGHVHNFEAAKKLGDVLVVGINSDASVRRYKGSLRPIIPARERAEMVASIKAVDHAFIFSEDNPISWIMKLRPHVHVKGKGAPHDAEKKAVKQGGGVFKSIPLTKGRSTSAIIETVARRYTKH